MVLSMLSVSILQVFILHKILMTMVRSYSKDTTPRTATNTLGQAHWDDIEFVA